MSKIKQIQHTEIRLKPDGTQYLLVNVLLDDGTEASIVVGGAVEVYYQAGQVRAFVKKTVHKPLDKGADV